MTTGRTMRTWEEIKWDEFKQVCSSMGMPFDMAGTFWREFKQMREGIVYIFGNHMKSEEYSWDCELRYDFMDFTTADGILDELNLPHPEPLPKLNKVKLFAFWKEKIPEHKKKYFEKASPDTIWTEHSYYRHWVQRRFNKNEILQITDTLPEDAIGVE